MYNVREEEIMTASPPSLIEFPCDFPIKVMGEMQATFTPTIMALIQKDAPEFNASQIEMRASTTGKYISLTCTVWVSSQAQLDRIYHSLSRHPLVKYTL